MVRQGTASLRRGERGVIVNSNASGAWSGREGAQLVWCSPGANHLHCIVRRPGERKKFGFPVSWLDEEKESG